MKPTTVFGTLLLVFFLGFFSGVRFSEKNISQAYQQGFEQGLKQGFDKGLISFEEQPFWEKTEAILADVQKNPEMAKEFLQGLVDIAVSDNLGMAIQVEDYATRQAIEEVRQLRYKVGVYGKMFCDAERNRRDESRGRDLVKPLLLRQYAEPRQDRTKDPNVTVANFLVHADTVKCTPGVVLVNNWQRKDTRFKIVKYDNEGNFWEFCIPWSDSDKERQLVVDIPSGNYHVEITSDSVKNFCTSTSLVVTDFSSISFCGESYRGIVMKN